MSHLKQNDSRPKPRLFRRTLSRSPSPTPIRHIPSEPFIPETTLQPLSVIAKSIETINLTEEDGVLVKQPDMKQPVVSIMDLDDILGSMSNPTMKQPATCNDMDTADTNGFWSNEKIKKQQEVERLNAKKAEEQAQKRRQIAEANEKKKKQQELERYQQQQAEEAAKRKAEHKARESTRAFAQAAYGKMKASGMILTTETAARTIYDKMKETGMTLTNTSAGVLMTKPPVAPMEPVIQTYTVCSHRGDQAVGANRVCESCGDDIERKPMKSPFSKKKSPSSHTIVGGECKQGSNGDFCMCARTKTKRLICIKAGCHYCDSVKHDPMLN